MMKYIFLFVSLFLTVNVTIFAQSLSHELDKIREIKLLEATRNDVKRILIGYKSDDKDEESSSETISSEKINIEVSYTTGYCSGDEDYADEWNVPKGKVKLIEITFEDSVTLKDLQLDVSGFRKEQTYVNVEDEFFYHNKDLGIAIEINDERVEKILLLPVIKQSRLLCQNEEAENLRKMYPSESFFFVPKLEDRVLRVREHARSGVEDIKLSATELKVSCSAVDSGNNKDCSNSSRIIFINTKSFDYENDDNVVFDYTVSGGRIVGQGKAVIWDLSDVKPGKYTITVTVDDGCGICGESKTKEVVVR